MPVITLESSGLTKEQKAKLIEELTATAASIMDRPQSAFTVYLKENNPDNIGVGGVMLSERK